MTQGLEIIEINDMQVEKAGKIRKLGLEKWFMVLEILDLKGCMCL